jgi:hypothetical protein
MYFKSIFLRLTICKDFKVLKSSSLVGHVQNSDDLTKVAKVNKTMTTE